MDSLMEKPSPKSKIHSTARLKTENTLTTIMQRLDNIEKIMLDNQTKLEGLTKACNKLMSVKSELDKLSKMWSGYQYSIRPDSRGSRPGSSGVEADCSSGGSETSLASVQQGQHNRKKLSKRRTYPGVHSQSSESLLSAQEEVTDDLETSSALALPRIVQPLNQPHVSLTLWLYYIYIAILTNA